MAATEDSGSFDFHAAEEEGQAREFTGGVLKHVLVSEQQKVWAAAAGRQPACQVFSPGTPISGHQSAGDEIIHISLQRVCILDMTVFSREVKVRDGNVPRVA